RRNAGEDDAIVRAPAAGTGAGDLHLLHGLVTPSLHFLANVVFRVGQVLDAFLVVARDVTVTRVRIVQRKYVERYKQGDKHAETPKGIGFEAGEDKRMRADRIHGDGARVFPVAACEAVSKMPDPHIENKGCGRACENNKPARQLCSPADVVSPAKP